MYGCFYILFSAVSFISSAAGAVCGIGGGVIIKPVLDAFGILSVASINFLSGCTVLGMSCCSVVCNKLSEEKLIEGKTGTPLAIGAAMGGVAGKIMFQSLSIQFAHPNMVGAVQAAFLAVAVLGTLIYTIMKERIHTHRIKNMAVCSLIGLFLGTLSSFLGIGGGPVNLVVLYYFFSLETKAAAQNSLYIILFSQAAGLISTLVTKTVPDFSFLLLILMTAGGVLGGACGQAVNKKISSGAVYRLFLFLMIVIIWINIYNLVCFLG